VSKTTLSQEFDPTVPLSDERYELFARYRVMGMPKDVAAWEAGFRAKGDQPLRPGNVARLDRHPEVKARKAFLAGDETVIVQELRRFTTQRLVGWAGLDVLHQFAVVESETKEGKTVSRMVGIDWAAWKASGRPGTLTGVKLDPATGAVVDCSWEKSSDAIAQLRDMYGMRAPRRKEISGPDGGPVQTVDLSKLTDEQLAALEPVLAMLAGSGIAPGPAKNRTGQPSD
jgi:hypothetical protein